MKRLGATLALALLCLSTACGQAPPKSWLDAIQDGRPVKVWGWKDGANVRYFEAENPHLASNPAKTKPAEAPIGAIANYGLTPGKAFASDLKDHYRTNGPRGRMFVEAVKGNASTLPDDSAKPFLSVIGTPEKTAPIVAEVKGNASLRDVVKVGEFEPKSWQVASVGLEPRADPTIILQSPDGTVLSRIESYQGIEELSSEVIGKLRRPNPHYDPALDPGPGQSNAADAIGWLAAGIVAIGIVIVLTSKGRK